MSITVRNWTPEELAACDTDNWLLTLLANCTTFSSEGIRALHKNHAKVKTYVASWDADDDEPVTIKATDDAMLRRFIDAKYTCFPTYCQERVSIYRPVFPPSPNPEGATFGVGTENLTVYAQVKFDLTLDGSKIEDVKSYVTDSMGVYVEGEGYDADAFVTSEAEFVQGSVTAYYQDSEGIMREAVW